ncbi:MAG: hypothetical protein HYZ54_08435 [Ignavibacteriae bacterium]|nr:hypothetical protein [Ignavibacteriota bacterium]
MLDFDKLFKESKGKPILYKGSTISRLDEFPISNEDTLIISIEKTNSSCRQGVTIDVTGHFEIDGQVYKKGKGLRMLFWEDTYNEPLKVFTKKGSVGVYNIWETITYHPFKNELGETVNKEYKAVHYWFNGAGMIVEEIENGRRYHCNDFRPSENFDAIVFTVQRIVK